MLAHSFARLLQQAECQQCHDAGAGDQIVDGDVLVRLVREHEPARPVCDARVDASAPAEVFVAHGSNEIIELMIRTFTTPDDEALLCKGSFLMYKVALQSHGRRFVEVFIDQNGDDHERDHQCLTPFVHFPSRIISATVIAPRQLFRTGPDSKTNGLGQTKPRRFFAICSL